MINGYLGVREGVQGVLIGGIGLLQIILHEITMTYMGIRYKPYAICDQTNREHSRSLHCLAARKVRVGRTRQPGKVLVSII